MAASAVNNGTVNATGNAAKEKFWNGSRKMTFGISALASIWTYKEERAQGNSRIGALGQAAMDFVLPELLGGWGYMGFQLAQAAPGMLINGAQSIAQAGREFERSVRDQSPFRSNTFVDSQQIYTMRQAGLALGEQSKYALQQSLMGDEARFMHR